MSLRKKFSNSTVAVIFLLLSFTSFDSLVAQKKASWIWYPGDFEIWMSNKMQNRRTERNSFFPPFWRVDSHFALIDFHKNFDLTVAEDADLFVEGQYNVKLDGKLFSGNPSRITIPAGKHKVNIKVFCQDKIPAIYVKGKTAVSDSSWFVTYEDKEWIDASGMVSDQSGTKWLSAGCWNFDDPFSPPSRFSLKTEPIQPTTIIRKPKSLLVDFGKETFGFAKLHGLKGKGEISLYYGESVEEAMAVNTCETLDQFHVDLAIKTDTVMNLSKAFRYINIQYEDNIIQYEDNISVDSVSMLYEYLPVTDRGRFKCSDEMINKIWNIASYTLHLNTREFFTDGIKRDRWIWSGDAYQSYLMNYYSFFDAASVTRTLLALRGKDPVTSHINTIMDYTFYWFLGIYDYYQYTGDKKFIEQFYPRMQSLMDFCLSRRNKNNLLEGLAGDWVFIDWADGLNKKGEVSFEQLLFCRSLETMALCAGIVNDTAGITNYNRLAANIKSNLFSIYWNENKHALVHSRINGVPTADNVTRYANMFAIFFGYLNEKQKQDVKQYVLLNDKIQQITTPYMRFYELEALCALGEQKYVLNEMKNYWGGMLNLGATTFWEKYDPTEKGAEHYAMYGRPFGKSLCHAWGASPIYLLGKYYLGVSPSSPGYENYLVEPELGGLQWMEGTVPTPSGDINLYCSKTQIEIKADNGIGLLRFKSSSKPVSRNNALVQLKNNNVYEIIIEKGKEYIVDYNAIK